MSQPSTTSEAGNTTDRHEEALLLPDLPYLPLLRVLSYLPSRDLMAVGRTCLRLAALTRAHPWLWRDFNYVFLKSNEEVWELLRVAPPVEWLALRGRSDNPPFYVVQPSVVVGNTHAPCRSLWMWTGNFIDTSVLRAMAPMVRRLDFSGVPLDLILNTLRDGSWSALEHLELGLFSGPPLVPWILEVLLPRMHTVTFEATVEYLEVFGSVLRAYSGQLRCVRIFRGELLPLVNDCPSDLNRLEVALQGGEDTAALRGMRGLKELSLTCEDTRTSKKVEHLLKSWEGPLERLELLYVELTDSLRVLRAIGFSSSLQCLVLKDYDNAYDDAVIKDEDAVAWCAVTVGKLASVLAALPRLHTFVLLSDMQFMLHSRATWRPVHRRLQELVRSAPRPLHVGFLTTKTEEFTVYARHSDLESFSCPLCAEAKTAAARGAYGTSRAALSPAQLWVLNEAARFVQIPCSS